MQEVSVPSALLLGNPRAAAIYCLMMVLFFTVLAVLSFVLLTKDTDFKKEWRKAFGGRLWTLPPGQALMVVLPCWLLACGWFYNATLGERFYEIRRIMTPSPAWQFIYAFPERIRPVDDADIKHWTGQVGWERRTFRHSLYVELQNGRVLKSAALHPAEFAEKARILEQWGIQVLPPATNSVHEPPSSATNDRQPAAP